ncbi:flocculation protein FLO11-like [Haliotis rubra]|uniref:flocculation protein FLO11-like n=1 Tax=Haliotis rubra TaxID=36100 RepID=UPI001EE4EBE2|nr:flocculation protein FLO11-like [Haliotis rubra]
MLHCRALDTAALLLHILASISHLQAVPRFPPPPRRAAQQQVPVICRDGWTPAVAENLDGGPSTYICIQTNIKSLPWEQSLDTCRANDAFLLKLDKRVKIGFQTLEEYITDQNLDTFWTGLHEEETKFVWDELNPSLVESYAGPHAGYGKIKRGWRWNTDSFDDVTGKCGVISLNHTLSRRKRASNSDYDDYMQARHNVDLDLPDSAPSGFRFPGLHYPPATHPRSKEVYPVFPDNLNSAEIGHFPVTDAPSLTTVTDSSSEEDNNDLEDAPIVKRSTMTKMDVTELPSSDDDQADETTSTTTEPSADPSSTNTTHVATTTPFIVSTTQSTPSTTTTEPRQLTSTELMAGSTSVSNSINTTTAVTASTSIPTSPSTTSELPSLSTSAPSKTTSSSQETPSLQTATTTPTATSSATSPTFTPTTSTIKPSAPKSTFPTSTTVTSSTTPSTPTSSKLSTASSTTSTPSTSTLETMQNMEITRGSVQAGTPFSVRTSDVTLPSSAAITTATPSATTATSTASTTTATSATTATTPTTLKLNLSTLTEKVTHPPLPSTDASSKTESTTSIPPSSLPHPTSTTATSTTTSAPVSPDTLVRVMGHTERLTSSVGRPPTGQVVQYMSMDICDRPHPSVCYSEPITALRQVSFCGFGWVGHPFVDKCYKVLTFPLNHFRAKARCIDEGGTMATIDGGTGLADDCRYSSDFWCRYNMGIRLTNWTDDS